MTPKISTQGNRIFQTMLVLFNLLLLISVWLILLKQEDLNRPVETGKLVAEKQSPAEMDSQVESYLRSELSFSENQIQRYRQRHAAYRQMSDGYRLEISRIRQRILRLLFNEKQNKSEIEDLSYHLGVLHEKLEKEVFFHFMGLINDCPRSEKNKFKRLLQTILESQQEIPKMSKTESREEIRYERPINRRKMEAERDRSKIPNHRKPSTRRIIRNKKPNRIQSPVSESARENSVRDTLEITDRIDREVDILKKRLSLSGTQVAQVRVLLLELHKKERLAASDPAGRDSFKQVKDRYDQKILNFLDSRQQALFRQYKRETRRHGPEDRRKNR